MKKEFFASSVDEALDKASRVLGTPTEKLSYQIVEGTFGQPMNPGMVAIVVEAEEGAAGAGSPSAPSEEEQHAREAGDTEWAVYLLRGILKRMHLDAPVDSYEKGEHVILTVQVQDGSIDLRRGVCRELRGAIQHIVNRAVSRGGELARRFILDIGGTLEGRSEKMKSLADVLAEKVETLDRPLHIYMMDSQDRRLLHQNLLDRPRLRTQGHGEKQFRVLSIEPDSSNEG
jgi:spoIIIJ-associated protein